MRILATILICALAATANAQVLVQVRDEQAKPVEGATIEVLRRGDSLLKKALLADAEGKASFVADASDSLLLRVSSTGFETLWQAVEGHSGTLIVDLRRASRDMQAITVTARKPFVQRLNDRLVLNVESSVLNAGASAMEVLEQAPGITVDQNDIIALRGKQGVIIMVDGKPSPMTGADLVNFLKGLPSNAVERIDIITNPSARYDAAGNSGIIDIRMKKDQRLGYNGSLTAGIGQGILPRSNAGGTFNFRSKTLNVFGNYSYSKREGLNHLFINRNFFRQGIFTGSDDKDNYSVMPFNTHTARIGADYFVSKNTIIGVLANGQFNNMERTATIGTLVADVHGKPLSRFNSVATNNDEANNVFGNINLKHSFNKKGRELTIDADYGLYSSASLTRTTSKFFNLDGSKRRDDDILDGNQAGRLQLRSVKGDFTNPLRAGEKMEAGFKSSYVSSVNDAKFFNVEGQASTPDLTKTNKFHYGEYNHAAYVNYSREWTKWSVQLGFRGENTQVETLQEKGSVSYTNDYFLVFPSAFVTYRFAEQKSIGISTSRRIDRPGYSQLNPFLFQIDANVYATGNPLLRPQTSWSYEMNYTHQALNLTLSYSKTNDVQNMVIARILDVIPTFEIKPGQDSNITVQYPINLRTSEYFGLSANMPVRVASWWNMMNNLTAFYNHFRAQVGISTLDAGRPAFTLRSNNNFTMGRGWQSEANFNYNSVQQYGFMRARAQWSLALGVQKNVMKDKGNIRFSMSDIFFTSQPGGRIEFENSYLENWRAERDSRIANLTFTYRFGNSKVQQQRRRSTASEEERQRAG